MTLREWIVHWRETCDKPRSRPTTVAAHDYIFKNHILPHLGDIPLDGLTESAIGDFLAERKHFGSHRPESPGYPVLGDDTMRHIHHLLRQCLDKAVRVGLIESNPARAFHYAKTKSTVANILTPLEAEDYLDAAAALGVLPMFILALTAGLRQREIIALRWSDLNVERRTLTVSEQRSVVRRELIEHGAETRTIALTAETVEQLAAEHAKHPTNPLMFAHPATQKPYSPNMVRRLHSQIIARARLDHIRFEDLRHTCAVLALRGGMSVAELSRMLGHTRVTTTRQRYAAYLTQNAQRGERTVGGVTDAELREASRQLDGMLDFG